MPKGSGQAGRRRGRYAAPPRLLDLDKPAAKRRFHAELARLAKRHFDAAPLALVRPEGARTAAESLARLEMYGRHLAELQAGGLLTADEGKSMPAIAREQRHLRTELGLSASAEDLEDAGRGADDGDNEDED